MTTPSKCKRCLGTGKIRRETCATCGGSGLVEVTTDSAGRTSVKPAAK